MTIYNLNFGIGWASSGVEYAQLYRRNIFKLMKENFKFIYLDFIQKENIQTLTENLGFEDDEIIWIYQYFTDIKIAPTTYTIQNIIDRLEDTNVEIERVNNKIKKIIFGNDNNYIRCYLKNESENIVDRAEYVSKGKLIKKEFYNFTIVFTEYYAPYKKKAKLYLRTYFNKDGSIAYEEHISGKNSIFVFPNVILYSKLEFIAYFLRQLNLTREDILLIDRSKNIGQVILENKNQARLGVVIHAEHFNHSNTNEDYILWNNNYEYMFNHVDYIDFFITATDAQKQLIVNQFNQYKNKNPKVYTIPVGSLKELKYTHERASNSIMTASRLAKEKHVDWLIESVVQAHKTRPSIKFDIYGEGAEKNNLQKLINEKEANEYIKLIGHKNLEEIYIKYQLYLSGSTSEGFGLTLMEAIGSGLGIIGFDVNYGNTTFIKDRYNGYRIPESIKNQGTKEIATKFAEKIDEYFLSSNKIDQMSHESYLIADDFLLNNCKEKWLSLVNEVQDD